MNKEVSKPLQCERDGHICGSQEPYPQETMAEGRLCLGCGRMKPNVKYLLASSQLPYQSLCKELAEALRQSNELIKMLNSGDKEWPVFYTNNEVLTKASNILNP
jgi:hypothetical protein